MITLENQFYLKFRNLKYGRVDRSEYGRVAGLNTGELTGMMATAIWEKKEETYMLKLYLKTSDTKSTHEYKQSLSLRYHRRTQGYL